ncbi:hypothetical protein I5Q34_04065 [Streptomyces sp. AV19]|uniref:hypothetical protein n=1 Tax=Streptomyces sp. AV19 TaxID=2793068 RepID=UPI0018FEBF59|nr:hypothetical protein [Streptomyces sp. AV19]MBH1933470.1 hypothetical protein [Streptomyces sp. AV19]MDG4532119.1 hypothetical protein [Streptomyces sp. AV19]
MLRHVIAPVRRFTQVSNDIIRHPCLSSDAKCLLLWLLSLADTAQVSFSEAARRAGIKNAAFQRAKALLKQEGYAHEWRSQGPDGRWVTTQLVSAEPLTAEEARAIRNGRPTPTTPKPAVGEPGPRPVGGHPKENMDSNTSPPPCPAPTPTPREFLPDELVGQGALVLASLSHRERHLRLTGREIEELTPFAADWLLRGVSGRELREELTSGLPEPVHHAAALIRDRLLRKLPEAPPARRPAAPPEPRVAQLRECRGDHLQPYLFPPVGDEVLCRDCRVEQAEGATRGAHTAALRGAAAARAALRGT